MEKEPGSGVGLGSLHFDSAVLGTYEWMTSSLSVRVENSNIYERLFSYQEVEALRPEGWSIPTKKEMILFLESVGFNQETHGIIPSTYYQVEWQYEGYVDPIIGSVGKGEKMHLWLKDDGQINYISINRDELTYQLGRTLPNSRLSARFIRK